MGSILQPAKIADFFHHLCDAITDVIFFMCRPIDAILGCEIFEKKTFDSMRLPSLVLKHPLPLEIKAM